MASGFVIKDAFVEIDGVDLSCHVSQVEVTLAKAVVDSDTMCGQGTLHGLDESTISVTFNMSFAAGEVHEVLLPLQEDETEFTVNIRPHGGDPTISVPVSATNPQFSATCKLHSYTPISGSVGDKSETDVEFEVQGHITVAVA